MFNLKKLFITMRREDYDLHELVAMMMDWPFSQPTNSKINDLNDVDYTKKVEHAYALVGVKKENVKVSVTNDKIKLTAIREDEYIKYSGLKREDKITISIPKPVDKNTFKVFLELGILRIEYMYQDSERAEFKVE